MQQELIEWSKTILLSESIMPRILSAINKENDKMLTLGYGSRHFEMGMGTYDFLDALLSLNIRKKNLEELSITTREILRDMAPDERNLLESRFFSKKSISDILPRMNIRTKYRRYNTALTNFARGLEEYGYTSEVLDELFENDKIISSIHARVLSHGIVFKSDEPRPISRVHISMNIPVRIEQNLQDDRLRA